MKLLSNKYYKPIKTIIESNPVFQKENQNLEISEEKDFELAIIQSKQQELLEIEKDKEEELIQLALFKSLEEMNQKKEGNNNHNEKNNVINIREEEEDETYGICPITQEYMKHPMLTPSGNYYEKKAIIRWIKEHHTDPMTREKLTEDMLIEDHEFKKKIKKLIIKQKNKMKYYSNINIIYQKVYFILFLIFKK